MGKVLVKRELEDEMDLRRLSSKAKDLVEKRGGTDSLKQDAEELKGIAKGQGSLADKAKAAVSAIKDPGAAGDGAPTEGEVRADSSPAIQASEPEQERADEKVKHERRGKHSQGEHGGHGRHKRGDGRGRDDDPAV
jgi:hypothetical protein